MELVLIQQANCLGDSRDAPLRWKLGAWSAWDA
jgi:hypothetical protein